MNAKCKRALAAKALAAFITAAAISSGFDQQVFHAIDLDNIGLAYRHLGKHSEARQYTLEALAVIEPLTTGKYLVRTKGVILHNLAAAYVELARYAEAEAHFRRSLAVLRSAPAEVEPWRLEIAMKSYADLLRRTGRLKEADELESQSKRATGKKVPSLQQQLPADGAAPGGRR